MLDSLRSFAGSPFGIVVFALLIGGLLFFGLGGFGASGMVARVGSQDITQQEFARAYNDMVNQVANSQGSFISPAIAQQMGIPDVVLDRMIAAAAAQDQVLRLGLGVSDTTVASMLARATAFQASNGTFSPVLLANYLRQQGYTEREFADVQRENILRSHVQRAVATPSFSLPDAYERIIDAFNREERTIRYTILTPDLVPDADTIEPTEEELLAYYESNTVNWQAPETRDVSFLTLSSDSIVDPTAISDQEVSAFYDARRESLGTPETRSVSIMIASQQDIDAIAALLSDGASYDDLVAAGQITPSNLGTVAYDSLSDTAVAEAAFAMEAGESRAILGRSGATLVHVGEVVPGTIPTLEEAADELRLELAGNRATNAVRDLYDQIEDARASGATLSEVGETFDLEIQRVTIDQSGLDIDGNPVADLPAISTLLTETFESDVGLNEPPLSAGGIGNYVWYEVTDIIAPHQRPFSEIRDRVEEAWRLDSTRLRLDAIADTIGNLLANDAPIETIETQVGVSFRQSEPLTRSSTPPEGTSAATLQAAFGGAAGFITNLPDAAGTGLVVLQVMDIQVPEAPEEPLPDTNEVALSFAESFVGRYLIDLRIRLGNAITADSALINQLIGLNN